MKIETWDPEAAANRQKPSGTCTKAIPSASMENDVDHEGKPAIVVNVHWTPVDGTLDRPDCGGYLIQAKHKKLVLRLMSAINAGVATKFLGIGVDIAGKTYVLSESQVMGKYMNADLKRLGY